MKASFAILLGICATAAATTAASGHDASVLREASTLELSPVLDADPLSSVNGVRTREPTFEEVALKWRLSTVDQIQSCEIELHALPEFGPTNVVAGPDCPDGFFNVVGWEMEYAELRFLSPTGRVMARFYPASATRWIGQRENDGAPLVMTRSRSGEAEF